MNRRSFVRWLGLAPVAAPAVAFAATAPGSAEDARIKIDNVSDALVSVRARPDGVIKITIDKKPGPAKSLSIGPYRLVSDGTRRLRG